MKISTAVVQQTIALTMGVPLSKLQPDVKFEDIGADSLDMVAVKQDIEDALVIEMPDEFWQVDITISISEYIAAVEKYCETLPA